MLKSLLFAFEHEIKRRNGSAADCVVNRGLTVERFDRTWPISESGGKSHYEERAQENACGDAGDDYDDYDDYVKDEIKDEEEDEFKEFKLDDRLGEGGRTSQRKKRKMIIIEKKVWEHAKEAGCEAAERT